MAASLSVLPWLLLVLGGVGAMQWGASRCGDLLEDLRRCWGLPATASGVVMGLATASPEISVNVASVAFGWPDLGLGAALGSNIPALPLGILLAYLATGVFASRTGAVEVKPQAVPIQVLPYLLVVLLLAALTLPEPWAGLQPIDGAILIVAYGVYVRHAFVGRSRRNEGRIRRDALRHALTGLPVIAGGALASVIGARRVGAAFDIPDLISGLFIIGLLCALPEAFAAWRFAREGRGTTAITSATADGIVSLTLALVPVALVGSAVGDPAIYVANLGFLSLALVALMVLNHRGRGQSLDGLHASLFMGGYAAYLGGMAYLLS